MLRIAGAVVVVLVLVACHGSSSAPQPPPPPPPLATQADAAPAPVTPPPASGKWACAADADCMNSCSQGAVNKVWYETTRPAECEDGCANALAEAPRCIDHGCVAYRSDPHDSTKIVESLDCTRRP